MGRKTQWRLMSWQEIREAQQGNPVVLIPAGTIETQGPYTYIGLECIVPERLAEEVARRTNALVAPTIPFGYSATFQAFPGTITLRADVVRAVYEDVVRSVLRHGFDHILFLAMHVPNQPMMEHVADKIRDEMGVLIAWINPGRLAPGIMRTVSPDYARARGHGADPGLSQALYLEPDAIDRTKIVPNEYDRDYQGLPLDNLTPMFRDFPLNMALRLEDVSRISGGWGDPTLASVEQGEAIFTQMVTHVTTLVEQFARMNTRV